MWYSTFLSIAEEEIGDRPFLSIYGKPGVIRIPRSTVLLFGHPRNICFMIDRKYESIAVMPCEEKHPMSARVPEKLFTDRKNICVRYNCTNFVKDLLFMNELDNDKAFLVFGSYDVANQRVIYRMNTAIDAVSLQIGEKGDNGSGLEPTIASQSSG